MCKIYEFIDFKRSLPSNFNLIWDITVFSFLPGTLPEEIVCCFPDSSTCSFYYHACEIASLSIPRLNNV